MKMPRNLFRLSGLILLSLLICTAPAVADGAVWIDTTGITISPGTTVKVPVKVSADGDMPLAGLSIYIEQPANAAVSFDSSSMGSFIYSDETGKAAALDLNIKGEQTLFYLDITPVGNGPISLSVTVNEATEGSAEQFPELKSYLGKTSTISAAGTTDKTPTDTPSSSTPPEDTPTLPPEVNPTDTPVDIPTDYPDDLPTDEPVEDIPTVPEIPIVPPSEPGKSPFPIMGILAGIGFVSLLTFRKTH